LRALLERGEAADLFDPATRRRIGHAIAEAARTRPPRPRVPQPRWMQPPK
jgi:hypothetical protein